MSNDNFIISSLNLKPDQIQFISTSKNNNVLDISITLSPVNAECPFCGGKTKIKGYSVRTYNHLPIAGTPCNILFNRRRYICKDCTHSFSEYNPFGPDSFHQTYAVLDSIAKDLKNPHFSFYDIATKHRVSTTIVQLYADSFLQVPRVTLPENLGIDELSSKMAKYDGSYLCILVDNEHRSLCDILPDRSKRTLSRYLDAIPVSERDNVKFVTIDLWEPYKDCALKYFKSCKVAADPFHVIKHLYDGFTRLRVDLMNSCVYGSPEYYLLKKWHKLLESDYDLDNTPQYNNFFKQKMNYRDLYNLLLGINPDLALAYQLKEQYRNFNKTATYDNAGEQLDMLIDIFESSGLYCYKDFVGLLNNWRTEIINSFERPYEDRKQSNALTEHFNSRLRELLSIANGFANFSRFRARAIYCLNDRVFYSLTQKLNSYKRKGKSRKKYDKHKNILKNDPNNNIDTMTDGPEQNSFE